MRMCCGCFGLWLVAILASSGLPAAKPEVPEIKGTRVDSSPSPHLEQHLDLVYAEYGDRKLHLDLFRPKDAKTPLPTVVVVHGGGWINGDKTKFRAMAQQLAERGYVTAAIEYRLAGEARFPAAIHDANAATRWLRAHAKEYGIDSERIGAVGGSAGGHLVGLMAAAPHVAELQGAGGNAEQSSRLQAAVVLAGPFELATGPVAERSRKDPEKSNTNQWLGKTVNESPELYRLASPWSHLSKETPPLLFLHGEHDNPPQNLATRRRLAELVVPTNVLVYTSGKHGCWNLHPWFEPMVDDIDAFLSTTLKKDPALAQRRRVPTDWGAMLLGAKDVEFQVNAVPKDGAVSLPRFNNSVAAVYLKDGDTRTPLTLSPGVKQWSLALPKSFSPGSATIVVETVGRPHLAELPPVTTAGADGTLVLAAHDAVTHGENLRYEPQPLKNTVGYWTRSEDWCEWRFYHERPGRFELHLLQGCGAGQGGSEAAFTLGEQRVAFTVEDTGHFQNFKDRNLGTLTLDTPGVYTIQLRAVKKAKAAVMDVRQVRLVPEAAGE